MSTVTLSLFMVLTLLSNGCSDYSIRDVDRDRYLLSREDGVIRVHYFEIRKQNSTMMTDYYHGYIDSEMPDEDALGEYYEQATNLVVQPNETADGPSVGLLGCWLALPAGSSTESYWLLRLDPVVVVGLSPRVMKAEGTLVGRTTVGPRRLGCDLWLASDSELETQVHSLLVFETTDNPILFSRPMVIDLPEPLDLHSAMLQLDRIIDGR